MLDLLSDPATTALHVVTTPEEMRVNETIGLVQRARTELSVPFGSVIVNRVLPEPFTRACDEPVFDALLGGPARGRPRRRGRPGQRRGARGHPARGVAAPVPLHAPQHRLRAVLDVPLVYLPYPFVRDHGLRVTRMVAEHLASELGL